jgi:dephospho-CoA kinase
MKIIGLTGSIGMGKSSAAQMLRRLGLPVFDADATVHRLMGPGGIAVEQVRAAFPDLKNLVTPAGAIDRHVLGGRVLGDPPALARLEAILHPLVAVARRDFLAAVARRRVPMAVLDVPLLYETGGDAACDAVLVVSAPAFLQRQRVLGRAGMDETRFLNILKQQVPDREKRRRTQYVVETGLSKSYTLMELRQYLREIGAAPQSRSRHARGCVRH